VSRICCLAIVLGCSTGASNKHDNSDTIPAPVSAPASEPPAPPIRVTVGDSTVEVEVVATEAKIQRGLMYREHLPPDAGMLFLMDREWDWSFWMRNTLIPLDLIFVTTGMGVAGIVANAKPLNDVSLKVGVPSLYVL
jgi:uncharacterized membrane protein (UPF0127 family)